MPSGNTTIKSRVNPSKFMGSAHAAGEELEERVSNNERKITLIKNILNYHDSLLPIPKPEEGDGDDNNSNLNIADRLDNIGDALGVIGGLFKLQLKALQDEEEQDSKAKADQDKRDREAALEAKKATKSKKKTPLQKGALGFFDTLKKFFLNVAAGAATLNLVEWFKNPANRDKILAFTNFLRDNAKAIFITLAALVALNFAASLMGTIATLKIVAGLLMNPWVLFFLGIASSGILFDQALEKIINWYQDPDHPERDSVGPPVPGAPKNALPGDWFTDKNGQVWQKMDFDSSNGGWQKIDRVPTQRILEMRQRNVDRGLIERVGQELQPEYAEGGRPPVGEVVTVGEKGRELFVADRSGTVVSNDKTEHVFNDGALLVAKSNTLDKISNTSSIVAKSDTLSNKSSSISQRVNNKHGSSKIIDLRRGQQQGSTLTAGNATTGNQIEGVSSVFPGDILVKAAQVQLGLVG